MSDNIILSVAKAIHASVDSDWSEQLRTPWEDLTRAGQDAYGRQARAAIAAMREPTEAMLAAADEVSEGEWQAMIDAALLSVEEQTE